MAPISKGTARPSYTAFWGSLLGNCQEQLQSIRWEIDLNSHLLTSWQSNNTHQKASKSKTSKVWWFRKFEFSCGFSFPQGGRKHIESCKLLGKLGLTPYKMACCVPKQCFFCEAFPSGISFTSGHSQVEFYNMTSARKSSLETQLSQMFIG